MQKLLRPVIIGHGWRTTPPGESVYVHEHQWRGTFDPASYLTVPAAIEFQAHHDWARIRADAHVMATYAMNRLIDAFGEPPMSPPTTDWWVQMVAAPIGRCDAGAVSTRLYEDHNIVIPIIDWGGRTFARISVQAYTTRTELDLLVDALVDLVPKFPHPSAKSR
jgi:isopenicillin-N epimerase